MKYPTNWPKTLRLKKTQKAGLMDQSQWGVFHGKDHIATLYPSSRGWAYAGEGTYRDVIKAGQGYNGWPVLLDAMWHLASDWKRLQPGGTT